MKIQLIGKPFRRKPKRLRDGKVSYMALAGVNQADTFHESQVRPPNVIETLVCNYFNENIEDIRKKHRHRNFVVCRQIIMFLMRRHTQTSLKEIGQRFNRDHTTVIHSVVAVCNLIDTDENYKNQIAYLESQLQ